MAGGVAVVWLALAVLEEPLLVTVPFIVVEGVEVGLLEFPPVEFPPVEIPPVGMGVLVLELEAVVLPELAELLGLALGLGVVKTQLTIARQKRARSICFIVVFRG